MESVIIVLAKNRQMPTQFSENGIFRRKFSVLEKKFVKKEQKTCFLAMVSSHLCLLATVFRVS
jgi:hypothetical protein